MAKPVSPRGTETRTSRSGCVRLSPRLESGMPVNQLKTSGTTASGISRIRMSSRIHAQLWTTVVRWSVPGALTRDRRSVGVFDDVLDRFALCHDRLDQGFDDRQVVRVVGIGLEAFEWRSTVPLRADRDPGQDRPLELDGTRLVRCLDLRLLDLDLATKQAQGVVPQPGTERDQNRIAGDVGDIARRGRRPRVDTPQQLWAIDDVEDDPDPGSHAQVAVHEFVNARMGRGEAAAGRLEDSTLHERIGDLVADPREEKVTEEHSSEAHHFRAYPITCCSAGRVAVAADRAEPRTIEVMAASRATTPAVRKPS